VGLFSDGTAVKLVGKETFRLTRALVDDYVVVDTDSPSVQRSRTSSRTRAACSSRLGALGVAAIKQYVETHKVKGQTLVAMTCGANMNFDRLRFVAERAEFGEQREALFAITIPEERGSFKRFCELIGPRSVTEFNYRISDERQAHVFVGLTISRRDEAERIARNFVRHRFPTVNLTDDELAKEHVRHMVGGHSELARDERLFRFVFPERPGALMRFLAAMDPSWNISLFHYRNQGADYGRILVGNAGSCGRPGGIRRLPVLARLPLRGGKRPTPSTACSCAEAADTLRRHVDPTVRWSRPRRTRRWRRLWPSAWPGAARTACSWACSKRWRCASG
jgi:threonine dehydratase